MTTAAQQLLDSFDALSVADKHDVAVEILRRVAPVGEADVSEGALLAAADELFRYMDVREAGHAER